MAAAPELIHARRTESLDAPDILKLVSSSTEKLFGRVNIINLIEKSNLAVTLVNSDNEIVAHAAFFDYPMIPAVDQSKWEDWLKTNYECKKATALNSLFMNYFVAKPEFANGCAYELIRTVFDAVPLVYYVFVLIPRELGLVPVMSDVFGPLRPEKDFADSLTHEVRVCYRHDHYPTLHIRAARVEDHDDLTPIFNKQSDVLTSTYGDYFLNELIEAQDDVHKCIVADVRGKAIGFMSVSSEVDIGLLTDCFNLKPFNGLRRLPDDYESSEDKDEKDDLEGTEEEVSSNMLFAESGFGNDDKDSKSEDNAEEEKENQEKSKSDEEKDGSKSTKELQPTKKTSPAVSPKTSRKTKGDEKEKSKEKDGKKKKKREKRKKERALPSEHKHTQTEYSDDEEFNPIYEGEKSAICVQLFCIDERYETRSIDFLPAAFELFPDKDYCVLTMPHTVPEFPLLQAFTRATPRKYSTLSQELYVFHRWGLDGSFQVRPSTSEDTEGIKNIVKKLKGGNEIVADIMQYTDARRDEDGTEVQVFVAESTRQVVGVAVIRREEDIEYIRSHYNIEDYVYYSHHQREDHAHLHHFCLNPVFQQYSKHFLKEILRLSHKSCLYYPIYPKYKIIKGEKPHTTVTALNDLVPIKARRQIVYPTDQLKGNKPSDRVLQKKDPFSLCHVNRKLTLEPKVAINARIVVVGASDVGIAFLESFVFCPHLRFNNMTLISPNGLPGQLEPDPIRSQFLPSSHCYSEEEHVMMSLRTWVNVVEGKMLGIDRTNRIVRVSEGHKVPYDYLLLCTGQQFTIPIPTGADISTLVTTSEVPPPESAVYRGTLPMNVLTVNSDKECDVVLTWIRQQFLNSQGNAIVYGATLEAFTMIHGMLAAGVPGHRIILVQPPQQIPSCFNNADIEEAVEIALKEAGITVHTGFTLATWNDGNVSEPVQYATFTSDNKPLKIECEVFFCFQEKRVDNNAFRAINESCLVYDGKLVVDSSFNTNDPRIRAAGPLTKYGRKYYAESWTHANFNSKEVGTQLAKNLLMLFDPTLEGILPDLKKEDQRLISVYKKPKIFSSILPGGFNYLHVGKAGLNLPLDSLMVQPEYGRELVTGSAKEAKDGQGYFRLHINQYKMVETITCYTLKSLDTSNLICLYGLHERYLNNLLQRFDEGLITNFFSFFRETWCHALFHDRFVDLREEAREVLVAKPIQDAPSLDEKVKKMIDEDLTGRKSVIATEINIEKQKMKKILRTREKKRKGDHRGSKTPSSRPKSSPAQQTKKASKRRDKEKLSSHVKSQEELGNQNRILCKSATPVPRE